MSDFMHWVTHGIKRGRFEMNLRTALYLFALAVVLTLVAALYLMLVSQTAARGRHIQQLQAELFRLRRENEQLEVELASEGSISRLWERAIELGFTPDQEVEFLVPVAAEP
jgi:cell division protein FtsL